jgi:putative solute:sodium symporter small subunit
MPEADRGVRPSRMRSLMARYLVAWLVFGLAVTLFVVPLNRIKIPLLGFPLGTYLAAQGALIVFVMMMLFTFAQQRQRSEREPD